MMTRALTGVVYLLHFNTPHRHAKHYLGFAEDHRWVERIEEHRRGRGTKFFANLVRAGADISFTLARVWEGKTRNDERRMKQRGKGHLCPVCCGTVNTALEAEIARIDWQALVTPRDVYTGREVDPNTVDEDKVEYCYFFNRAGLSDTLCTGYAIELWHMYGSRVQIFGFSNDDNPTSKIASDFGGHDFAVFDERYIVDPWLTAIAREGRRQVFDLQTDLEIVTRLYGDRSAWKPLADPASVGHAIYRKETPCRMVPYDTNYGATICTTHNRTILEGQRCED
jgi:hypothetical protein